MDGLPAITSQPSSGTGLLLLLCNLAPQWHAEFRAWLAEDMFPARRAIGFKGCASYDRVAAGAQPGAAQFLTLYDVASVGELYGAPYQALRSNRDARDAAFHARFRDLYRSTLAWVGPELASPRTDGGGAGYGFAPLVGLTRFALPARDVPRFNAWYVESYLPQCAALPGVSRVRRYLRVEATPCDRYPHTIVHEFAAADAEASASWLELCSGSGWAIAECDASSSCCFTRVIVAGAA